MSLHLSRSATAVALALSVGLVALPACKKAKPTVPDSPTSNPNPNPNPNPGPTTPGPNLGSLFAPVPPQTPVFGAQNPRVAAARLAAETNMKQITLALLSYEAANGTFPVGYADKTGKLGLSWRVAILPYLEDNNLLKEFKVDEPWDSEHNKKLIGKMPKQFAPPGIDTRGFTFARGFTGPNTWLPPLTKPGAPGVPLPGTRLAEFRDGTSSTFLVADAGDAVIWTKPDEIVFDPKQPPKLGGVFQSGIVVGMADGSVHLVRRTVSAKTLAAAIQLNDGGPVNLDE